MSKILLVAAVIPLVYYLMSLYVVLEYFSGLRKSPAKNSYFTPPASILKPVRGLDKGAYENFASFCRLDYPDYELLFGVADVQDPVIPVIQKLQKDFPQRDIRLITGVATLGANNKVNALCRLVQEAKHEFLVMSDSDVRVEADYLKQVAAPFARPEVGAVTTLYKSMTDGSLAADLNALGMALESAPSTLVARRLEGRMQFAFGWTMATTKSILAKIGGWESMANHHSDDFELGNRIARLGYRVELMRKPVWMVMSRETLRQYFAHELRWAIGLKNVRPSGYWGLICTQGLAWTGVAAGLAAGTNRLGLAAAYVLAYLILRLGLAWTAGVWGLGDRAITKKLWLVPLRDAIGFCVWIAGFFSDEIVWRGLEYRVRDKKLLPVRAMHHSTPGLHARREIAQLEKILP